MSSIFYLMSIIKVCTSEKFLSTPLLISPDLQDELVLYFWDIAINTTLDLTSFTRWTGFVLLRHSYQHHYWFHLIYKMNCLSTSETLLSTPLLISPDLQDRLCLYFWVTGVAMIWLGRYIDRGCRGRGRGRMVPMVSLVFLWFDSLNTRSTTLRGSPWKITPPIWNIYVVSFIADVCKERLKQ